MLLFAKLASFRLGPYGSSSIRPPLSAPFCEPPSAVQPLHDAVQPLQAFASFKSRHSVATNILKALNMLHGVAKREEITQFVRDQYADVTSRCR